MFAKHLTTSRLTLRPPQITDAQAAFQRYTSDPIATHFLLWQTHTNIEETRAFLSQRIRATADSNGGRWAICLKNDDSMWGSIAVSIKNEVAEIGYMLCPQLWGQGIMTEALNAVVTETSRQNTVNSIQAICHPDNRSSARVLEKCGFKQKTLIPNASVMPQISEIAQDCYLYIHTQIPQLR